MSTIEIGEFEALKRSVGNIDLILRGERFGCLKCMAIAHIDVVRDKMAGVKNLQEETWNCPLCQHELARFGVPELRGVGLSRDHLLRLRRRLLPDQSVVQTFSAADLAAARRAMRENMLEVLSSAYVACCRCQIIIKGRSVNFSPGTGPKNIPTALCPACETPAILPPTESRALSFDLVEALHQRFFVHRPPVTLQGTWNYLRKFWSWLRA